MLRGTMREVAAEFLGTLVLIAFGVAVVAQVVLSGKENGQYLSINLGWGLGVTMGAYVAGGISGAHLNPAVTLALALFRGFSWAKVLPYCLAQLVGAFVASAIVFAAYHEALDAYELADSETAPTDASRKLETAGIWATYPAPHLSTFPGGLIDQIVGTALLVGCLFALTDVRNSPPQANLTPLVVGALVVLIGMTFGFNCGYAINPARDLGPRLFTFVAGWGPQVFTAGDYWFWVPIVGPCLGAVAGGGAYELLIRKHHPPVDR